MSVPRARRGAAILAAGAAVLAGCRGTGPAPGAPAPPASLPLATSVAAGPVTWAVVAMGTAAPGPGQFWELVALAAGGARWTLATPPAVATSGAIALAAGSGGALVTGIYPSQGLRFSPVISTPDGGRTWAAGSPAPGLAPVPDALAARPGGGLVALALGRGGRAIAIQASAIQASAGRDGSWTTLATRATLAATSAGRACGMAALTAAAFSPAGQPVLGAECRRPGVAGILAERAGTWVAAGPPLPAALRGLPVRVLRLTRVGGRLAVLLEAGGGRAAALVAAWTSGGRTWTVSPPLPLAGAAVSSSAFGGDGTAAVGLGGRRAALVPGPGADPAPGAAGGRWRRLPALPAAPHVTLALPAGGGVVALAADGGVLTAWRLPPGGGAWTRAQRIIVPLPDGAPA